MIHGETNCQLYLIFPPQRHRDAAVKFMDAGDFKSFACVLLQSGRDGEVDPGFARELLGLAHRSDIPLLLENDISTAAEIGADGVHVRTDVDIYSRAREALGDDAIVGVGCGLSRHAGLSFAENGADYIAFSDTGAAAPDDTGEGFEELIAWWAETVTVPCVAWDLVSMEMAKRLAEAGADFVAMNEPVWSHAEGPVAAAAAFGESLENQQVTA